jgi:hypothetical protein
MRIFLPALDIGEDEGFSPEKDIFGRAALGAGLTNLMSNLSDPTVLALDGQWGSGKTTFLKMWAGELRRLGFPVVYLDAFRYDYAADAFTALASEIISLTNSKRPQSAAKAFSDKAIGAGKVLLRSSLKLGVKAATFGVLDAADLKEVAADIAKETSDFADNYVGDMLTKQKQQKETILAFQDALTELPSLLSAPVSGDVKSKPLIVIVDELDRCRPVFALEILERIKHFFSVPNVHFVLGSHLRQLSNSVKVAYGADIDSQLYLQKFIQLTVYLMDDGERIDQWATTKFINYIINNLDFEPEHRDLANNSKNFILHIAQSRDLSLRTIERIMTTMALALAFNGKTTIPAEILGGLCVLKNTDPELFIKAKRGVLTFDEIRVKFAFHIAPVDSTLAYLREHGSDIWMYFLGVEATDDRLKAEYEEFRRWFRSRSNGPQLLAWFANSVIDKLQPIK